jgi:HPt (histidine-containing phosphotransfer) domain-containing protein
MSTDSKPAAAVDREHVDPVVFDRAGMLARMMQDEVLARTVMRGYLADAPGQIEEIRAHVAAGDVDAVLRHAHSAKSSSGIVGGEIIRDVALQMQLAAAAGDLAKVARLLPELEAQTARYAEATRGYLAQVPE